MSSSAATNHQDFSRILFDAYKNSGALHMNTCIRDDPSLAANISDLTPAQLNNYVNMVMAHRGEDLEQLKTSQETHFTKFTTPHFTPVKDCTPTLATFLGLGCERTNKGICKKLDFALQPSQLSFAFGAVSGSAVPTIVSMSPPKSSSKSAPKSPLAKKHSDVKAHYTPRKYHAHSKAMLASARRSGSSIAQYPISTDSPTNEGFNALSDDISDLADEVKSLCSDAPDPRKFQSCDALLDQAKNIGLKFWADIALIKNKSEEKVQHATIAPTTVAAEVQNYTMMLDDYKKYVNEEEFKRNSFIYNKKRQFCAYESKSTNLSNTVALKIAEAEHESTASKAKIHQMFLEEKSKLERKMQELEATYKSEINSEDHQFELFKVKVKDEANDTLKFYSEEMERIKSDISCSEERKKEDLTKPKALIKVVDLFHELLQLRFGSGSRGNVEQLHMKEEADIIESQLYAIIQPAYKSNDINKMIELILNWNPIYDRKIQDIKL